MQHSPSHFLRTLALLPLLLAAGAHAGLLDAAQRAVGGGASAATTSAAPVTAPASGDLVSMVSSGLGVTGQQASGGLGALFNFAKGQLSGSDFGQIAGAVPGMDDLLAAAPQTEAPSGGGLLAQAGKYGKALQGAGQLRDSFQQLGLSSEMIGPFANIAVQYLEGSSPTAAALLKQVSGGLM